MKTDHIQYVYLLITTYNNLYATSFLQGAHSNTAIRKHYYDTNTLQKAKSLLSVQQQQLRVGVGLQPASLSHTGTVSSRSTTRLYGFLDRFGNNSNNEGDDDREEEEEEADEVDGQGEHERVFSSSELETARKSFEDMFTMPNDNQKKKKKKNKNTQPSSSYGIMDNDGSNIDNIDISGSSSSSSKDKEQRDTITKTRDITKIGNSIPQSPLTAIARERRLKEITLLSTLTQSDDAVSELWALWIAEKGPAAATLLLRAEQLMSVESYDEAESLLWTLVHQYGVHWAEPVNRLATLKYMQGRLEESKKLCEMVLQVKPWHFGALSGIVLVCTAMNDATGARLWAARRLPPLIPEYTSGDRRTTWITQALDDATESLNVASKVGRSAVIGEIETEFRAFRAQMQHLNMEDDGTNTNTGDDTSSSEDLDAWQ